MGGIFDQTARPLVFLMWRRSPACVWLFYISNERDADRSPRENPTFESRAAKTIREIFESERPLTYIRSPEEQPRRQSCFARWRWTMAAASIAFRFGSGAPPKGMRRDGQPAQAGTMSARGALDFIAAHHGRGDLPPQGLPRAAAGVAGNPAPAARRLRDLLRRRKVHRHHVSRAVDSGGGRAQPPIPGAAAARSGRAGRFLRRRDSTS